MGRRHRGGRGRKMVAYLSCPLEGGEGGGCKTGERWRDQPSSRQTIIFRDMKESGGVFI
jgi:hypothetical protein